MRRRAVPCAKVAFERCPGDAARTGPLNAVP